MGATGREGNAFSRQGNNRWKKTGRHLLDKRLWEKRWCVLQQLMVERPLIDQYVCNLPQKFVRCS